MASKPTLSKSWPDVALRVLIGVIGGYILASLLAAALALMLTGAREGGKWGMLAGYPVYVAAIVASFGIASVRRVALWFAGLSAVLLSAIILCSGALG